MISKFPNLKYVKTNIKYYLVVEALQCAVCTLHVVVSSQYESESVAALLAS